ncbi:hypothetical protein F5Y15DRAFT_392287 [Xylariaceae sp. FL0016]|nr:hypothetical protein F5Y15DRAFT_392287 [Xylariaceae sp. FL0016]
MPCKPEGLVLTVDPNVIHKVDTNNPQNLFSMWTVFSRCAESVEQGRRLENLSWRLWNRETFCCETGQTKTASTIATSLPKDIPERQAILEVPQLSGSVDSVVDEEAIEFTTESEPVDIIRPHIVRQDSYASSRSRGRERHITSDHLEKMVVNIIQEKEPNLSPLTEMSSPSIEPESDHSQSSCSDSQETPATTVATETAPRGPSSIMSHASSRADTSEVPVATTIVRGFSPSSIPSVRISHEPKSPAPDAIPEPKSSPQAKLVQPKKPAMFAVGCDSASSGDDSSPRSLQQLRQAPTTQPKRKMFEVGASSGSADESTSLKSAMHSARPNSLLSAQKKQTSFSNEVTLRTIPNSSDQSDSYVDESAIDDDDEDSEWEDSMEEGGKSSVDETINFDRVPSQTNLSLKPQRSLISLALAGNEARAKGLSNYASHSTPAIAQRARQLQQQQQHQQQQASKGMNSSNNSGENGLEMRRGMRSTPLKSINEIPRSSAQPITSNGHAHHHHQAALSPKTTRRNMLATELTESLRRQLLWERQQKTSTANAVLKRRHTSHDVANLKQYPEKAYMNKSRDEAASSWNQYLGEDYGGGYNAQGW